MFKKLLSLLFVFSLITFIVSVFAKDFGSIVQKTDTALYASEFQVIHDSGELSSAVSSYTISGLDGDTEQQYRLICRIVDNSAGPSYGIRFNNDSGNNYGYQYLTGFNATADAGRNTLSYAYIGGNDNTNSIHFSDTLIYAKSGYVRTALTKALHDAAGTTIQKIFSIGTSWNNTSDNITSLVVSSNQTNGIGVGSRIILLARSPAVSGSGEWQLVERKEVTGSAITSYTFSNLDGNTDVLYRLSVRMIGNSTPGSYLQLLPNNDTGANYGRQLLDGSGTTVLPNRVTGESALQISSYETTSGEITMAETLLYAKSGFLRSAISQHTSRISGTTVTAVQIVGHSWNDTANNITSLVTKASQTNGLGVGTVMELWSLKLGSSSGTTPTPTPTPTPTDTTAPSGSVSINSGASYTNSTSVTLSLSATDSVGVVGYYVSTSSSTPVASASGWNSVTSATSYSGSVSYTLTTGDEQKTAYVWFKDSAGNVSGSATDSIILDTTAPIVTITSPTSSDTYTATSSTVSPSGSASDTTSGVKEVTWSSDKGSSGTASGTTYWSISSVSLSTGDNKITVTAKDFGGNTSTDTITVTYSAATKPTVTTGSTSNVTATSATLTGTVNANGLSTTAWFEYGTVQGTYGSKSSTQTVTGSNDTTVSSTITGLTAETTYYYRIAAQNSAGTSYGSEMTFIYSSKGSAPTVTTDAATDVTTTTATLNGKVNANGISTTAWFEYGAISGSYGSKSNTKAVTGSTDTTVSASISGLTAGTTYYYRIVAQNSVGTSYGTEMSFYYSIEKKAPTVETESATDVTTTSAKLNGRVNPNGLSTTAWFEYGTVQGTYDYQTDTQSLSGSTYTSVSATITGLTAGTKYYYRIVAKNSAGTSYGTEMEFYKSPGTDTTPTPTPTITVIPTLPPSPQLSPTPTPVGSSGSISGEVKDGDGNVLQDVTVTIVGANGSSPSENSTTTDENGYYEFDGLAKGNYTLTYEKDGYQTFTKNVSLGEGEAKDLGSVTLETEGALGGIYGYVVDIKGEPIESVRLRLKGLRTKVTATETSDADGYFEFAGLGADTYVLTAKKKRYRNNKQKVTLGDGESKEIEIEMRKTTKKIKGLFLMDDGQ